MNTYTSCGRTVWVGVLAAGLAVGVGGCRGGPGRGQARAGIGQRINQALGRGQHLTLDGDLSDWPANVATVADADYIYFRVTVEGQAAPLQASPETLELWLDADNDRKTGHAM